MPPKPHISSFSILSIFTLLLIIGVAVMPLLQVNLEPSRGLPSVRVSYAMYGATGELIDAEAVSIQLQLAQCFRNIPRVINAYRIFIDVYVAKLIYTAFNFFNYADVYLIALKKQSGLMLITNNNQY